MGVALHHHLWTAHTVEGRVAWHDIIALELHARSDDIGRGMISYPLEGKHGRMTSGLTCHHRLWAAHTVERRRVWHAIIALGRQTRSDDVRLDMPSPPLDSIHGRTTSSVPLSSLGRTHGKTMSGVACHYCLWEAQTVERRRAWHDITALGLYAR